MLALVFLIFGAVVVTSMISLQESYLDEIDTYRFAIRDWNASHVFESVTDLNETLGMWPADKDKLTLLVDNRLGAASNMILLDDPLNVHREAVYYERSAPIGSRYESDRAIMMTGRPGLEGEETPLAASRNYCGDSDFDAGGDWCPNPSGVPNFQFISSDTQSSLARGVSAQELEIKALAAKAANYFNVNNDFPNTFGDNDVPLHTLVTTGSGASFNPTTQSCADADILYWGTPANGIPLSCRDLFSIWHVDPLDVDRLDLYREVYGPYSSSQELLPADRFSVPVRVFRDGDTLTMYVETPFQRYDVAAWSSTGERRGEQRPVGAPSYVFTQLIK